jgi:hypothetical protein
MNNKNYLANIGTKLGFILNYLRVFRLLVIIAYLLFLAMLVIDVFSAVSYVPEVDEVKGRFLPITAKTEIIGSIERYFLDRENSLSENSTKNLKNNPFAPHRTGEIISDDNDIAPVNTPVSSPAITPVPAPETTPATTPLITPLTTPPTAVIN